MFKGELSSAVEQGLYTAKVGCSIPSAPTICQVVRTGGCGKAAPVDLVFSRVELQAESLGFDLDAVDEGLNDLGTCLVTEPGESREVVLIRLERRGGLSEHA